MLVLTGKRNDEIYLQLPTGERVVVTVVQFRKRSVRLGFTAPRVVKILRRDAVNKLPPNRSMPHSSADASPGEASS